MLGRYWGKQCKNLTIIKIKRWSQILRKGIKWPLYKADGRLAKGMVCTKTSWNWKCSISEHKMGMESGLLDNSSSVKASTSKNQMTFLKSVTFMIRVNWQRVCGVIRVDARWQMALPIVSWRLKFSAATTNTNTKKNILRHIGLLEADEDKIRKIPP